MNEMAQPQAVDTEYQPVRTDGGDGGQNSDQNNAFLTVRYNKEELPLSREAAAEYAQKGLNYDKINGRLEKAQEMLSAYEDIGTAAKDYAQTSGIDEAKVLAALKLALDEDKKKQEAVNAQLTAFLHIHPDIDPRTLPNAVVDAWKGGTPLLDAYDRMRIKEQQLELARQTNAQNSTASMGGAVGIGAAAPRPISDVSIKMMSPAELEKNHSRIWAFLTGQNEQKG